MALDAKRVQKPVRKLRKLLNRMPSDPAPEDVHDLRTNCRRIEAMLPALSFHSKPQGRRMLKRISKLRKRAGKVRDMDVFTAYVMKLPDLQNEQECSVQLLEHMGAKRRKYANKLNGVRLRYRSSLRKTLKRTSKLMKRSLPEDSSLNLDATSANARATSNALQLLTRLSAPRKLGRANLHPFRLHVKELRSILQMSGDTRQQNFIDRLDEVKDAIGEWHDWEELGGIANKFLAHHGQCHLLQEIRTIAASKYRHALRQSQSLRKEFLGVAEGSRSRSSRNQSRIPAQPVWAATAALAA